MSNIPCSIIKDLLPSYCDNLCSTDTRAAVEMHTSECAECKHELVEMQAGIRVEKLNDNSGEITISGIAKAWIRSKRRALIKGIIITAAVCAALLFAFNIAFVKLADIPPGEMNAKAYMLENGNILCEYSFIGSNSSGVNTMGGMSDDGKWYVNIYKPAVEFDKALKLHYDVFDLDEFLHHSTIKAIYYGTEDDNFLIWEEGMEIPHANKDLEEHFGKELEWRYE